MKFSIITTCKNRLAHLRKSLPSFVSQSDCEVIVVDYDCPERTRDYVREHFPSVKIVEVDNEPQFSFTHARNLGALMACGDWLIFLDADVNIASDFTKKIKLEETEFGVFNFMNDVKGSCVVSRKMFEDIGGYDEVIFGYSQEDLELYQRLHLAGYTHLELERDLILAVETHSNEARTAYFDMGRKLAYARGKVYRDAKKNLLLLTRQKELRYEVRDAIWQKINLMLKAPNLFEGSHSLDIPLPSDEKDAYLPGSKFQSTLRITIALKQ
jgi:glycosyltransferase involved in cell wall biosynthesis